MVDFNAKVIVVTGAAGNLGRVVTVAFLDAGGSVCALDHRQGRLADLLPESNDKLFIYEGVDITERELMKALGERIQAEVGSVDILVNTVGGFSMGERVDQITEKTWQKMYELNVQSLLNASAAFLPGMRSAGHGKVITVGSGASHKGSARMGAYAAAKAAVLRLTESMAAELKSSNIQANCVLPGTIDTPQNRQDMPDADYKKWVMPEQVAHAILFLSSSAADEITGASLPIFGSK